MSETNSIQSIFQRSNISISFKSLFGAMWFRKKNLKYANFKWNTVFVL